MTATLSPAGGPTAVTAAPSRDSMARKPMKRYRNFTVDGKVYAQGRKALGHMIYPFFLVHMLAFGLSGFFLAYASDEPDLPFLYAHGGIACVTYTVFYLALFGLDEVKWMFINSALGLLGIYAQIDLILSLFGKRASDYAVSVHIIPFLYYVLYTFLLHQMVLDLARARDDPKRKARIDTLYVVISIVVYGSIYLFGR